MRKHPMHSSEASSLPCYTCSFVIRRSILGRLLRTSLLLTAVTIAILGTLSFVVARSLIRERVLSQMSADVSVREDILEETIRADRVRTAILAQDPDVLGSLGQRSSLHLEQLRKQLERQQISIKGIAVFDRAGVLRATSGDTGGMLPRILSVVPVMHDGQWVATDFSAAMMQPGGAVGTVIIRYDALRLSQLLFQGLGLGTSEQVILGEERQGFLYPFVQAKDNGAFPISIFGTQTEGAGEWKDTVSVHMIGVYRSLLSVGWGLLVQVPASEALAGTRKLAFTFIALGIFLLELTGILALALARQFTSPILTLSKKIKQLQTGSWKYSPSITTGDELEFLDRVLADLTGKLKHTYDSLEDEIAVRTKELKSQYALDRAILQNILQGVIAVDGKKRVTHANPAACKMLLLSQGNVVGKDATQLISLFVRHKGAFPTEEHPVLQCLEKGKNFASAPAMHLTLLREDSTFLPIMLSVTAFSSTAQDTGAVVVIQDVTEERQVDYIKSEFISLASHQLRTPLTAIRWYLEILRDVDMGKMNESQKSCVQEMDSASERMSNLLDSLLRVTRLEGEALTVEKQRIDVSTFLREVSEEWRENTHSSAITLRVSVPKRPLYFETDPTLLRIVLQNLFSNAVKYSNKGGTVELKMSMTKQSVIISVKDKGLGIPVADQARVFQKFFRAHNVRRMHTDGSGLGLYISRTILERLHGSIRFRSREGGGTIFTVVLPRK